MWVPGNIVILQPWPDRGYEVKLGCPMGTDGPIENDVPDDPNVLSLQPSGIYCRRPEIDSQAVQSVQA